MRVWDRFCGTATQDGSAQYNVEEELGKRLEGWSYNFYSNDQILIL